MQFLPIYKMQQIHLQTTRGNYADWRYLGNRLFFNPVELGTAPVKVRSGIVLHSRSTKCAGSCRPIVCTRQDCLFFGRDSGLFSQHSDGDDCCLLFHNSGGQELLRERRGVGRNLYSLCSDPSRSERQRSQYRVRGDQAQCDLGYTRLTAFAPGLDLSRSICSFDRVGSCDRNVAKNLRCAAKAAKPVATTHALRHPK